MSHRVRTISAILLALAVGACTGEAPLVEVKGACADVFKAQVCTWAKTKGTNLVQAGAVVPLASIENAPADQPMVWPPAAAAEIDMPEPVRRQGGLTQLTMYWEAGGHPPGAYMTPHFDFHFYTVAPSERAAMDCKDLSKPATLPAAYGLPDIPLPPEMARMMGVPALIGLCVPQMGMHALLASEIERKDAFSGSMVIGYYKGRPIFIEPMLSKAMLMRKQSFDLPIPDVPGLAGAHPTKFHAEYDATQQAYRFTFSVFTPAS
ncbi:MAG TPA: hypothetical protein VJJ98_04550 [Sedimentisphaerales bacterium]|nr:hypothetical protein [Sedimentisphaerales bacterium]